MSMQKGPTRYFYYGGAALAFLAPFVVYLITLPPGLTFEDPLEFALGAATLGVDHPSGYPLETLVGHLLTYLPVGEIAWRINVSSALAGALASAFIFLFTWEFLAPAVEDVRLRAAAAWAAAGCFALSRVFWPQAIITEVYALNAALFGATLWCGIRCRGRRDVRWFYATAFLAALAATNHPISMAATGPLLAYLWFGLRREAGGVALLVRGAALFILGVSVYLYLPIRSFGEPPINWGTPADLPRFMEHVGRKEFGTIYWPRYRHLGSHALELGSLLLAQYGPGVGLLALVGIGWHLRKKTRFAGILTLLAAITGPAMLFPLVGLLTPIQVFEIGVWYLAFFLVCAPLIAGAAAALIGKIRPRAVRAAATAAVALLPVYPAAFFWAETGLADFSFPQEHGRNRLRNFDYRAVLLFPYYGRQGLWGDAYYRFVEGRRRDVALADPRNAVPSEFAAIRSGPIFIRDPDAAEKWWFGFQANLIASHSDRTFFFNVGTDSARNMGVTLEPYALLYRARRPGAGEVSPAAPWDRFEYAGLRAVTPRSAAGAKTYDPTTYRIWALYFVTAAEYCFDRGRDDAALRNLAAASRAVDKDPRVGLFVASVYARNGYPEEAIPLYEMGLPAVERYRNDAEMFRRDYTSYMAEITMAYLRAGDVEGARPYFDEAAALFPDKYGPEAGVTLEKLAAMVEERRVIEGE